MADHNEPLPVHNALLRVHNEPLPPHNDSLSVCNDLLADHNEPLRDCNDLLRVRNEPFSPHNDSLSVRKASCRNSRFGYREETWKSGKNRDFYPARRGNCSK